MRALSATPPVLTPRRLYWHMLPLLAGLTAPLAHGQSETTPAWELDWRPWDELTEEERAGAEAICCGRYIEPPLPVFPLPVPETEPGERLPLLTQSREMHYEEATGVLELTGGVMARQGDSILLSDYGRFDQLAETAELRGNVRVREPGVLLVGEYGRMDQQAGTSQLDNATFVLHDFSFRGSAERILYVDADGRVTIDNGALSRCEPGNQDWQVHAGRIVLDQEEGVGRARHATLRVRNVPILYTPYISFPLSDERKSGFLPAAFGSTNNGGMEIMLPYYFNLAPNYDATYTGRLMSDRGWHHGLELRHMDNRTRNQLQVGFLPNDNTYDRALLDLRDEGLIRARNVPSQPERWYIDADHRGSFGRRWSTRIDYREVSDARYFRDFSTAGLQLSAISFLQRVGEVRYHGSNWQFMSRIQNFQIIDPQIPQLNRPFSTTPQLRLDGNFLTNFNLNYGLSADYSFFDRSFDRSEFSQGQIDQGLLVTGGRLSLTPSLGYRWETPGMFINPNLRYHYNSYQLSDQARQFSNTPDFGVFSGSVDAGLVFDRPLSFFGQDMTQTLEPRLYYLYNSYANQDAIPRFDTLEPTFSFNQLFRPNRFTGSDRIGDANQVTLALSTRLLDDRGRERASASIGQIFHFADRRVSLFNTIGDEELRTSSNIAGQLSYRFNEDWRVTSYVEWDTLGEQLAVGNFQFQYQSAINQILNAGFRYRDDGLGFTPEGFDRRIMQSDISGAWPINQEWGIIAKHNYDVANDRPLETIAGVEYSNCCWNIRVIYREWIDRFDQAAIMNPQAENDYGVFLQFELKGLGSIIGGNVASMLENSIFGYRQP